MVSSGRPPGVAGLDIKPTLTTTMAGDRFSASVTRRQAMAAREITTEQNASAMPVACALTPADLAAQAGRWEQLAARAMTGRAQTAHGVRISFRPEPGPEHELRELVAVQEQCCPSAEWTVNSRAGQIVLDVR